MFCTFWLGNVLRATTTCTFSTCQLPKVVRSWGVLYILTSKCASRHNGVHFFDIATSKSGPRMVCFVHFDLEMYFAPQRRALFRHLNFQKWSENGVFCTFWLGNVLCATTACTFSTSQLPKVVRSWCVFCTFWLQNVLRATTVCTFSTSQLPKVVRTWGVLYLLTWKCASRHNGVQFFISPLASWLRTRRFSEPTFRPSRATNHWKNTVFRDFPTFSRICIFCPLTLSLLLFSLLIFLFSLPLPYSAFHLSILSEVWLLNFLRPPVIIPNRLEPASDEDLWITDWPCGCLCITNSRPICGEKIDHITKVPQYWTILVEPIYRRYTRKFYGYMAQFNYIAYRVPDTWPSKGISQVFSGWFMSWKIALKLIKMDDQWGSPMSGNPQKIWDY